MFTPAIPLARRSRPTPIARPSDARRRRRQPDPRRRPLDLGRLTLSPAGLRPCRSPGRSTPATTASPTRRCMAPVRRLSGADYRRDLGAFFGSVHGTLNHLLMGDTIWMARFEGGTHPSTDLDAILFEHFDALRDGARANGPAHRALLLDAAAGLRGGNVRYVNNAGFNTEDPLVGDPAALLQSPDPSSRAGPYAAVAARPRRRRCSICTACCGPTLRFRSWRPAPARRDSGRETAASGSRSSAGR